jgi:hypothetical protein
MIDATVDDGVSRFASATAVFTVFSLAAQVAILSGDPERIASARELLIHALRKHVDESTAAISEKTAAIDARLAEARATDERYPPAEGKRSAVDVVERAIAPLRAVLASLAASLELVAFLAGPELAEAAKQDAAGEG